MDGGESQMLPTIQTSLKEKGFGSLEMRIESRNGSIAIKCYNNKTFLQRKLWWCGWIVGESQMICTI